MEAFTLTANGRLNKLIVPITVVGPDGNRKECPALIDTGATNTCISNELATELSLVAVSTTEKLTAAGRTTCDVYVVDLILHGGRVHISQNKVIAINLTEQVDVEMLMGMDILTHGDFSLTNSNGMTIASFRVPSILSTDFVPETRRHQQYEAEKNKRKANTNSNRKRKK